MMVHRQAIEYVHYFGHGVLMTQTKPFLNGLIGENATKRITHRLSKIVINTLVLKHCYSGTTGGVCFVLG